MNLNRNAAIIDLGSNTFHLLIFRYDPEGFFTAIYRERIFTGLAKGGVETIQQSSYERGMNAIEHFNSKLNEYKVERFKVVGTSALREANNGPDFMAEVKSRFDITIELISSDEEARLIYEGVKRFINLDNGNFLIMDIGGGSVEFIIVEDGQMSFAKSYKVGLGVLYEKFYKSDPISEEDHNNLLNYINEALADIIERLKGFNDLILIGSSGSFEVIEEMYQLNRSPNPQTHIPIAFIDKVYHDVIKSTYQERLLMRGLPPERADLIVVAMILIKMITTVARPRKFKLSSFAVKEGIIGEMLNI